MRKIIYNLDGKFQCASPAQDSDEFIKFVMEKDVPAWATDVTVVTDADIPSSRYFREAWKVVGGKVVIDMQKAKEIKLSHIRKERNAMLDETDKLFISKLEKGQDLNDIKSKRQKLRDIPQDAQLDGLTVDQLESFDAFK